MIKRVFDATFVTVLIAGASSALAVEAIGILNDTGQSMCYDMSYNAVPCDESSTGDESPVPRQDGRYGRDAAATMGRLTKIGGGEAGFDFTRICMNGDDEGEGACPSSPPVPEDPENPAPGDWACVRDNVTGLIWALGHPAYVTWAEAGSTAEGSFIQRANASARCGLSSGWRLPARREGYSVLHLRGVLPAVDPAYFPILANPPEPQLAALVWTSDPAAWHAMMQYTISFMGAGVGGTQCRELAPPFPCDAYPAGVTEWGAGVLLVNGAWRQPSPPDGKASNGEDRWQIRNDGLIVTDTATGLMWDRCTWGQTGAACEGDVTIFPDWIDGMQVARIANELRYKGYYDWRVPNVRELETLVKVDVYPAFDAAVFPNTFHADNHSYYWTSTSDGFLGLPDWLPMAGCVEFLHGLTASTDKVYSLPPGAYPNIAAVRLVRGGSEWTAFDGVSDRLFWADFDGPPTDLATVH